MTENEGLVRLNKYLSDAGVSSRRHADELILQGKVKVNNLTAKIGTKIDPVNDKVLVGDRVIEPKNIQIYLAFYKPISVLSAKNDELGRKTVYDFLPQVPGLKYVGRLDYDSQGLMIFTSDGDLVQRLTHPSFEHEKEYEVEARITYHVSRSSDTTSQHIINCFTKGLMIDGKLMKADDVSDFDIRDSNFGIFKVTLHTGYNRQIRKMSAKIGLTVTKLTRIRIGKLKLEDLDIKPGEYRQIKKEDII